MQSFYSINRKADDVSFREAILLGQAPDKGLYMPHEKPKFHPNELKAMKDQKYSEIAFEVIRKYIPKDQLADEKLKSIVEDAYDFNVPLEKLNDQDYIMRLDQGPTASFKDFAVRFLGRLISYFNEGKKVVLLTATSGDTGGAVADAFFNLSGVQVVILYPHDEVSNIQRRQMTTLGNNITAIGITGKFDDCQRMVKQAFADDTLRPLRLTSANSINFGRLLPQAVYYCYAWSRVVSSLKEKVIFSVPSGNFGNLMGGLLAKRMGLPVRHFIAATNANDEFPRFLSTGIYEKIEPSRNCLSNAMNVGHPSNLIRIIELYNGIMDETGKLIKMPNLDLMRKEIHSFSISDEETKQAIRTVFQQYNTIIEPHGAVGWVALQKYKQHNHPKEACISLETADPAKFPEVIQEILKIKLGLTTKMASQQDLKENLITMPPEYDTLQKYLLTNV